MKGFIIGLALGLTVPAGAKVVLRCTPVQIPDLNCTPNYNPAPLGCRNS